MSKNAFEKIYSIEKSNIIQVGKLTETDFIALKQCLLKSGKVTRKIKKYLS